jgi:hypothetical protein
VVSFLVLSFLGLATAGDAATGRSPEFHPSDDGEVRALAVFRGDLVAAGSFRFADAQTVNRIARWDGARWQRLGDGFDGPVNALQVSGDTLFAARNSPSLGSLSGRSMIDWCRACLSRSTTTATQAGGITGWRK